jgi:hypothetical protein
MKKLALLAASCLLVAGSSAYAAECKVPTIQTADNQVVPGQMTVTTNSWCSVGMGTGAAGISDPAVLKKPKHGEVVLKGFRVYYRSKKGFTGSDSFTYTRVQNDRWGNRAQRTVDMTVSVVP